MCQYYFNYLFKWDGTLLFQTKSTPRYPLLWRLPLCLRLAFLACTDKACLVSTNHTHTNSDTDMPPYPLLSGVNIASFYSPSIRYSIRYTPCAHFRYRQGMPCLYELLWKMHLILNLKFSILKFLHTKTTPQIPTKTQSLPNSTTASTWVGDVPFSNIWSPI